MQVEKFKVIIGILVSVGAYAFGCLDAILIALIAFVCIDFATGILKAIFEKSVSSQVMFRGGIKKIGIFIIVAVANILDVSLGLSGVIRNIAIGYYIANEGISILENWGSLGLPLPPKLKGILHQLKEDNS